MFQIFDGMNVVLIRLRAHEITENRLAEFTLWSPGGAVESILEHLEIQKSDPRQDGPCLWHVTFFFLYGV